MSLPSAFLSGRLCPLSLLCFAALFVSSCDGQHHGVAPAAHAAAVSSSSPKASPGKGPGTPTVDHTLNDQAWRVPYGTVRLPAGWGFNGTVVHGDNSCFSAGDTPMWAAESPEKSYGIAMLPALKTGFTTDPTLMRQVQQGHCPLLRSTSAAAFLTQYVLPHVHAGNLRIVSSGPEPQWASMAEQYRRMQAQFEQISNNNQFSHMRGTVETARILLQYQEGGRTMNEIASTLFTCTDTLTTMPMTGRSEFLDCTAPVTMIVHAPDDGTPFNNETLEAHSKDPAFFTLTQNPAWTQRLNQKMEAVRQQQQQQTQQILQQGQQNLRNQQNQFEASQQRYHQQQQLYDQQNAAWAARQNKLDEANQGFVHYLSGTNTYTNTQTGEQYELSNQYNHTYVNANGNVSLQTNSETSPGVDWTALKPKY